MWQTFSNERKMFYFDVFDLDFFSKRIIFKSNAPQESIDLGSPLFVKISFRESIFKGNILEINSDQSEIILDMPSEIITREFREIPRSTYKAGEKFVSLRRSSYSMNTDRSSSLKVSLKDISQKGLGFFVSERNMHLFKEGQFIELAGFEKEVKAPLSGEVIYSQKLARATNAKGTFYKVGVRMSSEIPDAILEKISRKDSSRASA